MSSPRSHSRQDQAQVLGRSPWLRLLPTVLMREDPKGVEERVLGVLGSGGSVGDGGGIPGQCSACAQQALNKPSERAFQNSCEPSRRLMAGNRGGSDQTEAGPYRGPWGPLWALRLHSAARLHPASRLPRVAVDSCTVWWGRGGGDARFQDQPSAQDKGPSVPWL